MGALQNIYLTQIRTLNDWSLIISIICMTSTVIFSIIAFRNSKKAMRDKKISTKLEESVFNEFKKEHLICHEKLDNELDKKMTYKEMKPYLEMIQFLYQKAQ